MLQVSFVQVLKVLSIDMKSVIKISRIRSKVTVAVELHLSLDVENEPSNTENLASAFLLQFEGYTVYKGVTLVLKHYGRKWRVKVDKIVSSNQNWSTDQVENLECNIKSLSMDDTQPRVECSLILASTKVNFSTSNNSAETITNRVSLLDFGGSHEVVEEMKKMCLSIFRRPASSSKSNLKKMETLLNCQYYWRIIPFDTIVIAHRQFTERIATVRSAGYGQIAPRAGGRRSFQCPFSDHSGSRIVQ